MSDFISRSALMLSLNDYALEVAPFRDMKSTWMYDAVKECMKTVEDQPTVEAKEVVRGEWIKQKPNPEAMKAFHELGVGKGMGINSIYWICSECGGWGTLSQKFCSNCGADMRKKVK